jgi:hypothetical protein
LSVQYTPGQRWLAANADASLSARSWTSASLRVGWKPQAAGLGAGELAGTAATGEVVGAAGWATGLGAVEPGGEAAGDALAAPAGAGDAARAGDAATGGTAVGVAGACLRVDVN